MELTQIRYFVAVAQCGTMSKAADQLHITQPSLSKAISKLETELGCQLFERSGKHIYLNDEGRRFLRGSLAMLRELDDATFDIREMTQSTVSRVTVGVSQSDRLLTKPLADFVRANPAIRVTLTCDIEYIEQLDINQFDMLLYPDDERYRKFKGLAVAKERYLLAVSREHAERYGRRVDPQRLQGAEFVFLRGGKDYIEQPYELCLGMGLNPQVRCFTNTMDMHRQIVASGIAMGFVREGCASSYRADSSIRLLPLDDDEFSVSMMVCFKRQKHLSATGLLFREHMQKALGIDNEALE